MNSNPRWLIALLLAWLLPGCATPPPVLPEKLPVRTSPAPEPAAIAPEEGLRLAKSITLGEEMPAPKERSPGMPVLPPVATPPLDEKADISLNFEQVPLTTFITVVYSELLKRPVNIDPAVMSRRDLVTVRTPNQQTPVQIENAARLLLKSYGLAALDVGGLIRVIPDNASVGYLPEIRRGAALPETPLPMRPLFQLVELEAVRQNEVMSWLKTMFGDRVRILEDATRNALLLSGTSDNVAAVIEAIRVLDQPVMHGRSSLKLSPAYWSAEDLAKRLSEILAAEGYSLPPPGYSPLAGGMRYPIFLMPVAGINAVLVFASSQEVMAHIQEWAAKLDQPSTRSGSTGYFTYTVRNTTAESLSNTLNSLNQGAIGAAASAPAAPAAAGAKPAAANPASAVERNQRFVVDKTNNALIFQTTHEDFAMLQGLLRSLDKPAKSALVEVTVAEVSLSDDTELGVEWLIKESGIGGGITRTLSGGKQGLSLRHVDSAGDVRLLLSALATSNRATILSTPRLMARNGETASMQVGREVPIITSQQSTLNSTTDTSAGVLQTVQYRNTGVILRVKPTIHSGDMVDLDVQQEVSSVVSEEKGVADSPIIANKKLDTKLSLRNGSTVLLGGLISSERSDGNAGVPYLKDIPLLGNLFGKETREHRRTELVVLITPYVISDTKDAQAITEAFRSTLTQWERPPARQE